MQELYLLRRSADAIGRSTREATTLAQNWWPACCATTAVACEEPWEDKCHVDKQESSHPPVRTQRACVNHGPQFDSIPKVCDNGNMA